jgi:hypothetical protein
MSIDSSLMAMTHRGESAGVHLTENEIRSMAMDIGCDTSQAIGSGICFALNDPAPSPALDQKGILQSLPPAINHAPPPPSVASAVSMDTDEAGAFGRTVERLLAIVPAAVAPPSMQHEDPLGSMMTGAAIPNGMPLVCLRFYSPLFSS